MLCCGESPTNIKNRLGHENIQSTMVYLHMDLLNKSKTSGPCGFPLTNLHLAESVDYGPSPKVLEDRKDIAYYINEFSICTKHKFDQK
jgi:hypothetical protein